MKTGKAKIYLAPMEGVTTAEYRTVLRRHYPGASRYFTPFLVANHTHNFKKRERRELLPVQADLVPQILTNRAEDLIWAARELSELGYTEINLNLGCPSATVVTKGKGAGMLADPEKLDRFFEEVFRERDLPRISVKTRLGMCDPGEAAGLAAVFSRYPLSEIIIHARVREDFYENRPNLEAFRAMKEGVDVPVCYNGDVRTAEDLQRLQEEFPDLSAVMIGRGIIAAPWVLEELRGSICSEPADRRAVLRAFLDDLWDTYRASLTSDRDVLFRMKELWYYLGQSFPGKERALLDIRKARTKTEYQDAFKRICHFQ